MVEQRSEQTKAVIVAKASDIPIGQMKGFTVADKKILIANVAGKLYSMDALCSHAQGYLPTGRLDNDVVTCPVHGAQFDVTTGCMVINLPGKVRKNVNLNCRFQAGHGIVDLRTYQVTVEGNEIKIRM
jgi:nitrite reductase/ring-hydroxylating ferredoxin subunit